jgi:hypothetical protein
VCCEHDETERRPAEDLDTNEVLDIVYKLDRILVSILTGNTCIEPSTLNKLKNFIHELDEGVKNEKYKSSHGRSLLNASSENTSISLIQRQIVKLYDRVHQVFQALQANNIEKNTNKPASSQKIQATNKKAKVKNKKQVNDERVAYKRKSVTPVVGHFMPLHTNASLEKTELMNSMPVSKKKYQILAKDVTLDPHRDKNLKFPKVYTNMDWQSHAIDIEKIKKYQKFIRSSVADLDIRLQSVPGIGIVYSERLVKYIATIFELVNAATSMEKHDFKALMKCYANINSYYSELIYLSMLAHHRKLGCENMFERDLIPILETA